MSNRQQFRDRSTQQMILKATVERLAEELQITPLAAYDILLDGLGEVTKGTLWDWWLS